MFLLQAIKPPAHEVIVIDVNARAMSDDEIVQFVREQKIELVGIGAMTRMIAKAYRVADAIRASGVHRELHQAWAASYNPERHLSWFYQSCSFFDIKHLIYL